MSIETLVARHTRRIVWLIVATPILFAGPAPAAEKPARPDPSEAFFATGAIPHVRIEIAATNLAALRRNARKYVPATVREGDTVYEEVGVHLKGAAGSFRPVDSGEPAMTLNFDRFRDRQKFHGLDKLHLNNSVQDRSFMCEALCARLFLESGVPTARSTHARVWLNGRDLGFYVLKEGYDKTFLRRHFQNFKGNLYDGGFLREITDPLERDSGEGDVPIHSDLKSLAAAAQEPDHSKRIQRLEQLLDLDRFLSFVALEILTWHWDGYAMKRNNYRVYHDPGRDKIVFFPHGMDQMFWDANQPIVPANPEGLVARALLQTAEGRRRYRARVAELAATIFTAEKLTNHINELQARIRPVLAAISPDRARQFDGSARNVRNQVLARVAGVQRMLGEPEPEPLKFTAAGFASPPAWRVLDSKITGQTDTVAGADGRQSLHITAIPEQNCTASWRSRVLLARGDYILEARVRTAGVVPIEGETVTKGIGAGIRISRATDSRPNNLVGDNDWQHVEYEFPVMGESEDVTLICELRAAAGEVWFDLASLKLRKLAALSAPVP